MTRYNDLCEAYFAWVQPSLEVDRILRDVPRLMKSAILEHLDPPAPAALMLTMTMRMPTAYADLYRARFDQHGEKQWERCQDHHALQLTKDGARQFIIGICFEQAQRPLTPMILYCSFTVESVNRESVGLRIENLERSIAVSLTDPAGYAAAAKETVDLLMEFLRTTEERRIPIGFAIPIQPIETPDAPPS